ncbi:MAG: hypothetical protein ACFFEO_03135 [Candidatus Thorarchaeota archaeon]
MVIREVGLLFRGFTLVKKSYHKSTFGRIDVDLRSGLLTALLNFADTAFTYNSIEYFEGKKFVITFTNDTIRSDDSIEPEPLISYAILDKEKKVEKYIHKVIQPLLFSIANEFKKANEGKNLSEVTQFKYFKNILDYTFGSDAKNIDQKLKGLFY